MNDSLSEWGKFQLMLWKNWRSHWNHRTHFLLAILTPALFTSVLIALRIHIPVIALETSIYKSIDLSVVWLKIISRLGNETKLLQEYNEDFDHNQFLPQITLAYAPDNEVTIQNIMASVSKKLYGINIIGYRTTQKLQLAMMQDHYFAGINFIDNTDLFNRPQGSEDSIEFKFSLIFPSELRVYDDTFIGSDWSTDSLHDQFAAHEQRFPFDNDGGYVGYVREGFLTIQDAVSMAFIETFTNTKLHPSRKVRRFPYHAHVQDMLNERMEVYLAFIILSGFLYPCMFITWCLAKERENTMKEVFKIYGIRYYIQFFAWFFFGVLILFTSSFILVSLLKIPLKDGHSVITYCSFIALLIFLTAYSMASVSFCFMINSFCKRVHTAIAMLGVLWLATFLPIIVKVNQFISDTLLFWTLMHCFSNTAMSSALLRILEYEQFSRGFTLKNFFVSHFFDDKLTVGITTLILLVQCFTYTIIGLYVDKINPGSYGVARKWNYLFSRSDSRRSSDRKRSSPMRQTKVFEVEPQYKRVNVQIERLSKSYNNTTVVNDVHMNFFENELFVIMGHNGCGKTTLLMMLIGLLKPSSGAISIYGFDISKNRDIARSFLGVCMQYNMVLPDLSASEQLRFYCRLKGMKDDIEVKSQILHYLRAMELGHYYNVYTRRLTAGEARLLGVCCALCGQSKVVILDMPSVGMDLVTRKMLWRLLLAEKANRTIIMTTHCPQEAEALGSRLAMMSGGELKCMGTTNFLKNMYGLGHRLVCSRGENCDINKVTETVHEVLPGLKPESNIGIEFSYRIKQESTQTFAKLLNLLEEKSESLNLDGFYITNTTLEDIFLSMGSNDPSEGDIARHKEIMNGTSALVNNYDDLDFLKPYKPYSGLKLLYNHWQALLYKRFLIVIRTRAIWIELFIAPFLVMALAIFMSQYSFETIEIPALSYSLSPYTESITPVHVKGGQNAQSQSVANMYLKILNWKGLNHRTILIEHQSMDEYIFGKQEHVNDRLYKKYIIGATFSAKGYTAWFNNFALHSAPLSLNMVHNAILNTISEHSVITVTLSPLPFFEQYHAADMRGSSSYGNFLASALCFCNAFVISFTVMYIINERQARFKLLQHIAGLRPLNFWLTSFAYDLLVISISSLLLMAIMFIYQYIGILDYKIALDYGLILFIFGISIMPFNYLISELFVVGIYGYFAIVTFNVFGCVTLSAFIDTIEQDEDSIADKAFFELIFRINPYFSLCRAFYKAYIIGRLNHLCAKPMIRDISVGLKKCHVPPNCCVKYTTLAWDNYGILPEFLAFAIVAMTCIIIIILKDTLRFKKNILEVLHLKQEPEEGLEKRKLSFNVMDEEMVTAEQLQEKLHVLSLEPKSLQEKPLVLRNLTKRFKNIYGAHSLFLVVEKNECLGLIGPNGVGKTTLLKLLIGEEKITTGIAFVNGVSTDQKLYEIYKHIGYCPENTSFPDQLTLYELMSIFAMLHGIPNSQIELRCESLAKVFGFIDDLEKRYDIVSFGNRRRLSIALAFLKNPTLICLDAPFKCIDPAGIRQQWKIFSIACNNGKAVLISANRVRECSTVCTRVAALSNGTFHWIGAVHSLKKNLPLDYLLRVKVKSFMENIEKSKNKSAQIIGSSGEQAPHTQAKPISKILLFVETEFPNSFLKEENGLILYFHIPKAQATLADIFTKIHGSYVNMYIEDFTVSYARFAVLLTDMFENAEPTKRESYNRPSLV